MTNETKLKPCPFCWSNDLDRVAAPVIAGYNYWVACNDCSCTSSAELTRDKAVKRWNARSTDSLFDEMIEVLEIAEYKIGEMLYVGDFDEEPYNNFSRAKERVNDLLTRAKAMRGL